jgi:hypothetical protein
VKVADYLRIGEEYVPCPEGLRWVNSGEAIEFTGGRTFALRQEIALFLEGFGSVRPLLPFPMMLHMLALVGQEAVRPGREVEMLQSMFRLHNRPLRNAGVLCARLCGGAVPSPADLVDVEEVRLHLQSGPLMTILMCHWRNERPTVPREHPAFTATNFEQLVLQSLRGFTLQELKHWLQHGRGPIDVAAEEVAREMSFVPPRALGEVFSRVAQRGRVAAVLRFVDQMISALALPPRRLEHQELPLGGYADLNTRGQPEQILFSQFALDEMEFVRRFAENELLYFRREEPHKQTREELLVLLDQGVRTWGDVRLLLTAAVLAFARLAQTRKMPFRLTGTSVSSILDPLEAEEQTLGDLLEASDLSLSPGLALERVLEEPAEEPREVLLLTHPRNLGEEDVRAAARRMLPGTRLFAVTADEQGDVHLSELRHGTALAVTHFRVDLTPRREEPPPVRRSEVEDMAPWTGDVEPIGFPFGDYQIPRDWEIADRKFDFDRSGEWLLVTGPEGMLQAHRLNVQGRPRTEVLPRALFQGGILQSVDRVAGANGGFLVGGCIDGHHVVAHYNFSDRRVRVYKLIERPHDPLTWGYSSTYHALVYPELNRRHPNFAAIDLATGVSAYGAGDTHSANRAAVAALDASNGAYGIFSNSVPVFLRPATPAQKSTAVPGPYLTGDADGSLELTGFSSPWKPFSPQYDGKPMFLKGATLSATLQSGVLVLSALERKGRPILAAFRGPDGTCLGVYPMPGKDVRYSLSADGHFLAVQGKRKNIYIRDLRQDGRVIYTTQNERRLPELQGELGERSLIVISERHSHLFCWQDGTLECQTRQRLSRTSPVLRAPSGEKPRPWENLPITSWKKLLEIAKKLRPGVGGDNPSLRLRFLRRARSTVLVGADPFGHVAVFDVQGVLVCLFYFSRMMWSVWLPDGSTYRSLGGDPPEKSVVLKRLGQALRRASEVGMFVRS